MADQAYNEATGNTAVFGSLGRRIPQPWLGYAIAIACVALAFGIRLLLAPILLDQSPFLLFLPAVLIASAFGGAGPGILATALGLALGLAVLPDFPSYFEHRKDQRGAIHGYRVWNRMVGRPPQAQTRARHGEYRRPAGARGAPEIDP